MASDTFLCVVCGAGRCYPVYPATLPWVKRCAGCGVRCTWPQPSDEELAACYDAEYGGTSGREGAWGIEDPAMKEAHSARLLARVERQIGVGRLLDVGCGTGGMLASAARRGWQVAGIEPNRQAAGRARQRVCRAEVFCGPVEAFAEAAERFDLITCLEVIEHLRDPAAALSRLYGCLRPGGLLVATTPDASGVHARLSGRRWVHWHRDHLWYFDRRSLRRLAMQAGFAQVRCGTAWKVFTPKYVFTVLARFSGNPLVRQAARVGLRWMPGWIANRLLPPLPEGLFLWAQRAEARRT